MGMLYEYEAWDKEKENEVVKQPDLYTIKFSNDDVTPMDFVVDMLIKHFNLNIDVAADITFRIHDFGSAVCGAFTLDVADTKLLAIKTDIMLASHPLRVATEIV